MRLMLVAAPVCLIPLQTLKDLVPARSVVKPSSNAGPNHLTLSFCVSRPLPRHRQD